MHPGAPTGYHFKRAESEKLGSGGNVPKGGRLAELGTWGGGCGHMDLVAGSGLGSKGPIAVWGWGGGSDG